MSKTIGSEGVNSSSVASGLHPLQRQQLAVQVLSKQEPISQIAQQEQVSRKFLYQHKAIAIEALNTALEKYFTVINLY